MIAMESSMSTKTTNQEAIMEPLDFIEIWARSEESARGLFGFTADQVHVVVLRESPQTEREIARYTSDARLYGIRLKSKAQS